MSMFRYRAMTSSGTVIRGTLEAASEAALIQQLRNEGHYPLSTSPTVTGSWLTHLTTALSPKRRVSPRVLTMVTQELASLLQAGLELDHALGVIENLSETGSLREPFRTVRARVRDGASLSEALSEQEAFPKFFVSMVRAGEHGAGLDITLSRLADYLTRSQAVRETITSALIYPTILMISAGLSIVVILTVVLPEFKPLFAEAGKTLPWPTRIVMGIGDFFQAFWWLLAGAALGGAAWFRAALKRPAFRRRCDGLLLRLPGLGPLLAAINIERFARTLGTLLVNGVALPAALNLAKDSMANTVLADAVRDTAVSLREGEGLARRLAQLAAFPPVILDLIRIGEETGKLGEMLLRQADLDEQRIRHRVDRMLALLVPGLTILLGLIVGGLVASLLVAILGVNDLALQ